MGIKQKIMSKVDDDLKNKFQKMLESYLTILEMNGMYRRELQRLRGNEFKLEDGEIVNCKTEAEIENRIKKRIMKNLKTM